MMIRKSASENDLKLNLSIYLGAAEFILAFQKTCSKQQSIFMGREPMTLDCALGTSFFVFMLPFLITGFLI